MILHKIYLVIFLISTTLKIVKKLYYKLMQKVKLSLYFFNIYNLITNFLIIKFNKYIFQINSNFYSNSNFNRKVHTPLKASYNKS
jgi:hypothetical protein